MSNKKNKGGRPKFEYTEELANEICGTIATSEKGLHLLCKANMHWPHVDTVHQWILSNKEFSEKYARAKALQADYLFEQIIDIADNPVEGSKTKTTERGIEVSTGDMTEHRKIQIDARKFTVARLAPKKYGDKVSLEHSGVDGNPIESNMNLSGLSLEELSILEKVIQKREQPPKKEE